MVTLQHGKPMARTQFFGMPSLPAAANASRLGRCLTKISPRRRYCVFGAATPDAWAVVAFGPIVEQRAWKSALAFVN